MLDGNHPAPKHLSKSRRTSLLKYPVLSSEWSYLFIFKLLEVHSPLASEPKTTRLVSSDVYPGISVESSLSRSLAEFSRDFAKTSELRSPAESPSVIFGAHAWQHSNNVSKLRLVHAPTQLPESRWLLQLTTSKTRYRTVHLRVEETW